MVISSTSLGTPVLGPRHKLDWAKIIHIIEIVLKNFKTKQGPGQKLASIVGLAHYKPAYSWAGKQLL